MVEVGRGRPDALPVMVMVLIVQKVAKLVYGEDADKTVENLIIHEHSSWAFEMHFLT